MVRAINLLEDRVTGAEKCVEASNFLGFSRVLSGNKQWCMAGAECEKKGGLGSHYPN